MTGKGNDPAESPCGPVVKPRAFSPKMPGFQAISGGDAGASGSGVAPGGGFPLPDQTY